MKTYTTDTWANYRSEGQGFTSIDSRFGKFGIMNINNYFQPKTLLK